MISTKNIVNKLNAKIANSGLTEAEFSQIHAAEEFLTSNNVSIQANTVGDLPDGPSNIGRMIYVIDEDDFYYYDVAFGEWSNDFSSSDVDQGILYAWGDNGNGDLGVNDTIDRSSPVTVAGGITNWSDIASGSRHSLGLTDTGVLYAWGFNDEGRLGINDGIDRSSPVTVVGGITNWSQVSAGKYHSLGLTDTGVLYAWGGNSDWQSSLGQLGDGTGINRSSPVTVVGGITNWSDIAAGKYFSLGLTDTGVLYAWGQNYDGTDLQHYGMLGTNDTTNKSSPVTVVGGITNWSHISAGEDHSHGITDTGVLYAWGSANVGFGYRTGRLGTDNTTDFSSPVTVVGGITNWSQVAAGSLHSLGLTDTGVLYAWGRTQGFGPNYGVLGTNDAINRSSPVTVVGGITNWSKIAAGGKSSVGLTDTGVLYAWGDGVNGRLGTNNTTDFSSPVTIVGGIANWSQVALGDDFSLAIAQFSKGFPEA